MATISPDDLAERLSAGDDLVVLDIRRKDDYSEWHIPGSRHLDIHDELQTDPDRARTALADLPRDEEIVTVCAAGVMAQTATDVLDDLGFDASTLTDGMAGWSRVHRHAPLDVELDGTLVQVARPGKGCLSHLVISDGEAAVFDASHDVDVYESVVAEYDAAIEAVFDTHAHADHVSGGRRLADRHDVPYFLHPRDAREVTASPLADGDRFAVGAVEVTAIHTPGHSPGGVTFDVDGVALLTGDTLFHESVGRVELGVDAGLEDTDAESNAATLYESLQRLLDHDGETLVLPSHDPGSPEPPVTATLEQVVNRTPALHRSRTAFVEALASDIQEQPPNFRRIKRLNVDADPIDGSELATLELGPNRCAAE